ALLRRQAQRAVEADGLAVQHRVVEDVAHQERVLLGAAEAAGERHRGGERGLRRLGQPAQHRRLEDAGGDRHDADAVAGELARRGQGERGDAALGGGVGGLADLALERGDRGGVDDHAALAFGVRLERHHLGGGEAHQVERADQVDPDHQLELGQLHRAVAADDALGRGDPGAVDEDRGRAVRAARLGERMLGRRRIADVALQADGADPRRRLRHPRGVDVEQRDLGPGARQHLAGGEPEARRPAGHHRRLILDLHRLSPRSAVAPGSYAKRTVRPSALSEAGAIARFGVMSTDTEYSIAHLPVSYTPPDEQRFWRKVRRVVARVPFAEDLLAAYFCAMDRDTPSYVRGVLLGAVAYFVLPLDMIPDI